MKIKVRTEIRKLKSRKGLTTEELAILTRTSQSAIRSYENGLATIEKMSLGTAIRLCEVLECEIKDLFTEKEYKRVSKLKKIKQD